MSKGLALPLTVEQKAWMQKAAERAGGILAYDVKTTDTKVNPLIAILGAGPAGMRCKDCAHLYHNGRFLKCDLRHVTHGPGTDHRANWPACSKFEFNHG